MRASMYHNVFLTNTTSLKWNPPLVNSIFSKTLHLPLLKECTCVQKMLHYLKNILFWKGIAFINQAFYSREKCMFWKVILQFWNCLCLKNAMYFALFFCNPFLPARNIVVYQIGMRSCFDFSFACLHVKRQQILPHRNK